MSRVKSAAAGHGCQRWHCLALGRVPLLHAGTSSCDSWAGPSIQGGESRTRFCCFQVKLQKSLEQLSKEVEDMKKRESEAKMKTQECKAGARFICERMSLHNTRNLKNPEWSGAVNSV